MIRGKNINLRLTHEKDLDTLYEMESDLEGRGVDFHMSFNSYPGFRKAFQEHGFWKNDYRQFVVVDKQDRVLGIIFYMETVTYHQAKEVGYILYDQESRGKGIMTEALNIMLGYIFDTERINRIQLVVDIGNEASRRVALKNGFQKEGIFRQAIWHRGEFVDLECYSLLREEYCQS